MTAAARLEGVEACVFDAYGTLFDVHSAVGRHRARVGEAADSVSATWRSKQLQYTWLRSLMHRWTPFSEVTADALDFALDEAGIEDGALRRDLLDAYRSLECYPEVAACSTPCGAAACGPPFSRTDRGRCWTRRSRAPAS